MLASPTFPATAACPSVHGGPYGDVENRGAPAPTSWDLQMLQFYSSLYLGPKWPGRQHQLLWAGGDFAAVVATAPWTGVQPRQTDLLPAVPRAQVPLPFS